MAVVSIIIPVFNQLEFTQDCLDSLVLYCDVAELEILVVDNGSTDGTREYLAEAARKLPSLKVITLDENQGYAKANNLAAQSARGEYLVFLNNDTVSFQPWISKLLAPLEADADIGICGGKLIYPNWDLINSAGYVYNSDIGAFYPIYEMMEPFLPAANKKREYQALLGACIAMRAKDYRALGGFNDIGLEDIDLCLRARRQGQKVLYVPEASIYHFGSVTLHNSDISKIPASTTQEFKATWGPSLVVDDTAYYKADGYKISELRQGRLLLDAPEVKSNGLLAIAILKCRTQQLDEAEGLLREAIGMYPLNRVARSELVLLLIETKRVAEALELSANLVVDFPTFIPGVLCHAQLLAHANRVPEALRLIAEKASHPALPAFQRRSVQMVSEAIGG